LNNVKIMLEIIYPVILNKIQRKIILNNYILIDDICIFDFIK